MFLLGVRIMFVVVSVSYMINLQIVVFFVILTGYIYKKEPYFELNERFIKIGWISWVFRSRIN